MKYILLLVVLLDIYIELLFFLLSIEIVDTLLSAYMYRKTVKAVKIIKSARHRSDWSNNDTATWCMTMESSDWETKEEDERGRERYRELFSWWVTKEHSFIIYNSPLCRFKKHR